MRKYKFAIGRRKVLSKRFILIIVGVLTFVNVEGVKGKSRGYRVIGPVMGGGQKIVREEGDTLIIEKDPVTHVVKSVGGLNIDIKKKYGVSFSQLDKVSKKEIDRFCKRFLKEYQEFIPISLDELVLTEAIKDSSFRWGNTDSAYWDKKLIITYSHVYNGIPICGAKLKFVIYKEDGINSFGMYNIHPNIDISTTPSISKTQAVELAKRHLRENAEELEFPDTVRDYKSTGFTVSKKYLKDPKVFELWKKNVRGIYSPEIFDILEKMLEKIRRKENATLPQNLDTGKIKINIRRMGSNKIYINVGELKSTLPVTIELKDNVELFILPKVEKDTINNHLAYQIYLVDLPRRALRWKYWVDAQNGEIIEAYKGWAGPPQGK